MIGKVISSLEGVEASPARVASPAHAAADLCRPCDGPLRSKVRSVRLVSPEAAILRAIVGMVPPGQSDLNPALNAHQTLIAARRDGLWHIHLLQTTSAQFHGRPDLIQRMTEELRQVRE